MSRLGDFVVLSSAQGEEEEYGEIPRALRTLGALAIPVERWKDWPVRSANELPLANHAVITDAWILGAGRMPQTIVDELRERCYGGDTLSKEEAIALVDRTLATLRSRASKLFDVTLVAPDAAVRFEKLYFDGPAERDWMAFAFVGDEMFPVLDREHLVRIG